VPGNHDYYNYGDGLENAKHSLMKSQLYFNNLNLKNKITICYEPIKSTINNIDFIGCTLWTDLNRKKKKKPIIY
jgi:hypothetical protein